MVAEVFAGLGAFKTMFDMAKGLKDINDAAIRNGAVIELQEQILTAQTAQAQLIDRIRDLEEKVTSFESWKTEKNRYELKRLGYGCTAYMLKKAERGTETPHWACARCYHNGKIFILQFTVESVNRKTARRGWFCPECHNEIEVPMPGQEPQWLD